MQDYLIDLISSPYTESVPDDREQREHYSREEGDIMWHSFYQKNYED